MNENISLTTLAQRQALALLVLYTASAFRFPVRTSNGKARKFFRTCGLPIAGGQGIEPRFFGPKPNVLPLDDPPIM